MVLALAVSGEVAVARKNLWPADDFRRGLGVPFGANVGEDNDRPASDPVWLVVLEENFAEAVGNVAGSPLNKNTNAVQDARIFDF